MSGRSSWRGRAKRAALATSIVVGGAVASGIGVGYVVAETLTRPQRPGIADAYTVSPYETGADFEDVAFSSLYGGYLLQGWWLSRPETNRVVVGLAGYRGSRSELIGIATILWRAGFNVLLFDYNGHGAARGAPVTLGYREVNDFYAALEYVHSRVPDARIGAFGGSMGAAVAILGSAKRDDVLGVVADSPFATHAGVVSYNVSRVVRLPGAPFARIADYFLYRRAGYHNSDVEPVRAAPLIAPRPLLIIHGTDDTMIPVEHGRMVYEAAREPKELWLGQGAEHCGTYFLDREAYGNRITAFFERALGPAQGEAPPRQAAPSEEGIARLAR